MCSLLRVNKAARHHSSTATVVVSARRRCRRRRCYWLASMFAHVCVCLPGGSMPLTGGGGGGSFADATQNTNKRTANINCRQNRMVGFCVPYRGAAVSNTRGHTRTPHITSSCGSKQKRLAPPCHATVDGRTQQQTNTHIRRASGKQNTQLSPRIIQYGNFCARVP